MGRQQKEGSGSPACLPPKTVGECQAQPDSQKKERDSMLWRRCQPCVHQIRLGCSRSLAQVESPMWKCFSGAPLLCTLQSSHVHATCIGTAAAAFPRALQAQVAEVEPVFRMIVVALLTHLVQKGWKLHWLSGPCHFEASRTQFDIIF